ncbi:MAG TPA: SagB/ThcOx family dehydrogenase [Anaeromyxobacter sp.]|nr:SagB/ThcOx family dehydrogenase [Anaeromyxobacter sp.]
MASVKILLVAAPAGLLLAWLAARALGRAPPARSTVTIGLSVVTLLYFLGVVGTGVFWVAAQELPVFDWHYLTGYVLLALAGTHVVLHWRNVAAFLRRQAPAAVLEPDGRRFRAWARRAGQAAAIAAGLAIVFVLGMRQGSRTLTLLQRTDASAAAPLGRGALLAVQVVEAGGERMPLAHLYHRGSSYPARVGLPGLTLSARPPVYLEYPGEGIPLPPPASRGGAGVVEAYEAWRTGRPLGAAGPLTLETLASLLHHAQGISATVQRQSVDFELRTAPSAGALYPVNLYLAAEQVPGLAPGFYYYHPKRHALLLVRADGYPPSRLAVASGSPGAFERAPAALVLTVTFGRTAFKYAERAYRYVAMDAGHAAYNLSLAAAAAGWRAPLVARFDDRAVATALALTPAIEAPLLVVPLAREATATDEPRFAPDVRAAARATFVDLIHGATSMRVVGGRAPLARHPSAPVAPGAADVPLPAPRAGTPLLEAIRARRSVREYGGAPLSLAELSALLAASAAEPAGTVTEDPLLAATAPLQVYLVVREVERLPPGVYRYVRGTHALQPVAAGERAAATRHACFDQDFCGKADVVVVKAVRWDDLYLPDGDRGYRYANLRAGVVGEGLYVAATSLGLGACGVGAFGDDHVAALVGLDPALEVPLYLTAVGRRASP